MSSPLFATTLVAAFLSIPLLGAAPKLIWSEEFEKDGPPDPARWTQEEGFVRNKELQFYTAGRSENARIENGRLIIEARREEYKKARYTSASLTTEGKTEWRYGRIEVKAKLPSGRGTWPAIWMLGTNHKTVGWPKCGEIDIMEHVGHDPGVVHANIHTTAYNHAKKTNKGAPVSIATASADFHLYAVEWTPERMDFFVDDQKYFSYENEKTGVDAWPFDQKFYLILNLAIGGSWGGEKGVDDNIFPQRMEVDYVRVYELAR